MTIICMSNIELALHQTAESRKREDFAPFNEFYTQRTKKLFPEMIPVESRLTFIPL